MEPDPLMEYKQGTKIKKSCFIITIILVKNQIAINVKTVTWRLIPVYNYNKVEIEVNTNCDTRFQAQVLEDRI